MYPSTEELVAASSLSELTSLEAPQQDALRTEAIGAIERHCRQAFLQEGTEEDPVTKVIDGNGGEVLYLPARLAELTEFGVSTGALTASDVALSEKRDRLHLAPESAGSTWATRVIAEARDLDRAVFPAGPGTVEITGVWGWPEADYPAAVTTALRFHMEDRALTEAHKFADTVRSAKALGVDSIQQGNLSLGLGGQEKAVSTRVRRELADLRWPTAGTGALA